MPGDYIKISRKITDWEWYKDVNTKVVFFHLLIKANWKPGKFQGVDIPRGSLATSLQTLSSETGLSVMNVRTALKHLKSTGELTVNQHPKFSVITINNYAKYQADNTLPNNLLTEDQQAANSRLTTIEEGKKERREEEKNISFSDEKLSESGSSEKDVFVTIRELYNSVCGSYPRLMKMSDRRKKAINARLRAGYTVEDFKRLFEKAEASTFLRGENGRDWSAKFDWLIADTNMPKVLEGNYDDRKEKKQDVETKSEPEPEGSVRLWDWK